MKSVMPADRIHPAHFWRIDDSDGGLIHIGFVMERSADQVL